ncbi:unnamed protein product [Candidula unifasciata]|uniref:NIF3-like protein 1 n=1 Tax=Candidula unifasciata TaxID=100452 RepID=A0A8S3YN73_9EUPU|nr:unnamed protein product [Candidula unifasciata]
MNSLKQIVGILTNTAPLHLAADWDNVGLLVEPSPPKYISKLMLTNDLTVSVMEEAKNKTVDLIISYHPPIFRPFKRLSQGSWKERILVDCIENRIAVFSPHTSHDAVQGGVNDWLLSAFDVKKDSVYAIEATQEFVEGNTHVLQVDVDLAKLDKVRDKSLIAYLPTESRLRKNKDLFTFYPIKVNSSSDNELWQLRVECTESELSAMLKGLLASHSQLKYSVASLSKVPRSASGFGRRAELSAPVTLETAISKVKSHLGLSHISVAKAIGKDDLDIQTVAVCAGSGSGVLNEVTADLLLTGEMGHHEVLDAVHGGSHVILCHHSNTERGYLKHFQQKLVSLIGNSVEIFVSEADQDPLEVV